MTRGRLPQHVYWRRRITLVAVIGVLVVGVVALVGGIGGGSGQRATTVSDVVDSSAPPSTSPSVHPHRSKGAQVHRSGEPSPSTSPSVSTPAVPSGPCAASDVVVTPSVASAVPGQPVSIRLAVTSASTPACTWQLGPGSVQVVVDHAGSDVWNTATCRKAVPTEALTVEQATPTYVTISWGGRVGSDGCSIHNDWASVGTYKVKAAALGGPPASSTFQMGPPVITEGPSPSDTPSSSTSAKSTKSTKSAKSTGSTTTTPSGSSTASSSATGGSRKGKH